MLDFIFAVQDPLAWHKENIGRNPDHYSFLSSFGPSAVVATAERIGAGVYFNALVPWQAALIKYGVVSLEALHRDLVTWDKLYVAGRMQKPVLPLRSYPAIDAAQAANLQSALRAALLVLPQQFRLRDLLCTLCGLSYAGDVRMGFAEDSRKVERIVRGSEEGLRQMYAGPLRLAEREWGVVWPRQPRGGGSSNWTQDGGPAAQAALIAGLPAAVLQRMSSAAGLAIPSMLLGGRAELAEAMARLPHRQRLLRSAMASVVRASSRRQAAAGLLSAGVLKSVQYAAYKLRKAWL